MLRKVTKTLCYATFCRITTAHRCEVQAVLYIMNAVRFDSPILAVGKGWTISGYRISESESQEFCISFVQAFFCFSKPLFFTKVLEVLEVLKDSPVWRPVNVKYYFNYSFLPLFCTNAQFSTNAFFRTLLHKILREFTKADLLRLSRGRILKRNWDKDLRVFLLAIHSHHY